MPQAGFGTADITPALGVELAGYFNKRFAERVLDPLYARALVVGDGEVRLAVLALDLIGLGPSHSEALRSHLSQRLGLPPEAIVVCCTHTHTGPCTGELFEAERVQSYLEHTLLPGAEQACKEAADDMRPFQLSFGRTEESGLAFCRRHEMKSGRVLTNPPKGSPDILRPESDIDHAVQVLRFERDGKLAGLVVDANNHSDTIGTSEISADWPGWMVRAVQEELGRKVPALLLNGPAGNINHFDPDNMEHQSSYAEAERIGRGYARFVLEAMQKTEPIASEPVKAMTRTFPVPYRTVAPDDVERARQLAATEPEDPGRDMTSEDLAKGHPYVDWLYARELVRFHDLYGNLEAEDVEIGAFRIGDCAFVGLPGEAFTDQGLAIKAGSPFESTCVFSLYNGLLGYVPMARHFGRGGYEPLTTAANRLAPEAGDLYIENGLALLAALK